MIKKKAFAKLNLNLHIIPKKNNNNYYPVRFINTQLTLYDELLFEPIQQGIEVICDHKEMPRQEDNLVYKAALLLQEMTSQKKGIRITIKKNIPITAGLGGGSTDAAVTINTLSKLWNIPLTKKQLTSLANILGKDVNYSLSGGLAEIAGDGDKVTLLPFKLPKFWTVIIVPRKTKPSTEWMYAQIDKTKVGKNIHFLSRLKEAIKTKNKKAFLNYVFNDFERAVFKHFPVILTIKKDLESNRALKTLLCGSGLSIVGFFTSKDIASQAKKVLNKKYEKVLLSQLK